MPRRVRKGLYRFWQSKCQMKSRDRKTGRWLSLTIPWFGGFSAWKGSEWFGRGLEKIPTHLPISSLQWATEIMLRNGMEIGEKYRENSTPEDFINLFRIRSIFSRPQLSFRSWFSPRSRRSLLVSTVHFVSNSPGDLKFAPPLHLTNSNWAKSKKKIFSPLKSHCVTTLRHFRESDRKNTREMGQIEAWFTDITIFF